MRVCPHCKTLELLHPENFIQETSNGRVDGDTTRIKVTCLNCGWIWFEGGIKVGAPP